MPDWAAFIVIGLVGGAVSGLFGIGGGLVIIPLLIYWKGFSHHLATGTSLAVLLPPIGLAATVEYYRHGHVDLRAALFIAAAMLAGAWGGAFVANQVRGPYLRLAFGVFVCAVGVSLIYGAGRRLGWF